MSKQNKRNGRLGRIARQIRAQQRASGVLFNNPLQKWDPKEKAWVRL